MDRPTQQQQREVNNNRFGDHVAIHQGDTHNFANAAIHRGDVHNVAIHLPHQPARAAVRVIPYPRNEDVVYRPELVDRLDALLPSTSQFSSVALWGLGGSGKTQIALQHAYRQCNDRDCSVFWVHADNEATFTHDYKLIGKKLGVDGTLDGENFLVAVRDGIEGQEPWVLVLDNADDLALFGVGSATRRLKSLLGFIPRGGIGTVLWTSRDERIVGTLVSPIRGIQVARMTPSEARELLAAARNHRTEDPETNTLLDELQCLPLAISQAGAYMRRTATPLRQYLSLLAQGKQRWSILKESEFDRHRKPDVPNSILETWSILISRIRKESEMAYRILHVIAYIDNQDIPHDVVMTASGSNIEEETGEPEDLQVTRAMTRLKEFSFVSMRSTEDGSRSYEMHKLVQEALRYGLSVRKSFGEAEGNRGNSPDQQDGEEFFSGLALEVIAGLFPSPSPETRADCEKFLRHAVRIGEWSEISGKEIETAELLIQVGSFLWERGRWRETEAVVMKATNLRWEILGENHPATMLSMANLSSTYAAQGRYSEAEEIGTKVLALRRETLGERHADTISAMKTLAELHTEQGRHTEAEEIATKALALTREILGEKHPETIRGMSILAKAYQRQGRYGESEEIEVKGLSLRREVCGEKDPHTLGSMHSLAVTYHFQDRYSNAEGLMAEVLALRREILGEKHPTTLLSMYGLAAIYHCQDRYIEAEGLMAEALALRREVLGEKHPDTLLSMHSLASVWNMRGRREDALSLMEESVRQQRSVLGQSHPLTEESTLFLEYLRTN